MSTAPASAAVDVESSFRFCRRITKRTAGNFYYSFLTLPRDVRRDMCALYAYMRVCDDLGDDVAIPLERRRESLAAWRADVLRALDGGEASHPFLPALADMIARRGVPIPPLLDVIDGVEMDLSPVLFESFETLSDYCYHVAGAVGLCCIHVWGFDDDAAPERAIECGLAFQLTNILRDLGEDARMGRVYLPQEDLDRFGYRTEELARGVIDDRFRAMMAFQVARARDYYRRSEPLADSLTSDGRKVLSAMRRIYGGLLDEIERRDYDVFTQRIALPRWRKLAIVAATLVRPQPPRQRVRDQRPGNE